MNKNEFTCCVCGNTYEKSWSDEEAKEEFSEVFKSEFNEENTAVVCDDCYKQMMNEYPVEEYFKDMKSE
jgi:hypothetical protein